MAEDDKKARLEELEALMQAPDFWSDKARAQAAVAEYQRLKDELAGGTKYEGKNAIVTIFSGAGGDDAEDFSRILFEMYVKFAERLGLAVSLVHEHKNDHGGYRNITFRLAGKGAYGILKNESGVHRLVRVSPFSAKKLRHTSFSLVEVVPEFDKIEAVNLVPEDLRVEFARSSGPGGQNVNKRETAVRVVHVPTGLVAHADSERSQERNREAALALLRGKLYKKLEADRAAEAAGLSVSKSTEIEWGSQIRSYVLHPYQLVKDHRTGVEVRDVDAVLAGHIEPFLTNDLLR